MKVCLRDLNLAVVEAWQDRFVNCPYVNIAVGDIFKCAVDAMVTPGNSFADMTGGMDYLCVKKFGKSVQDSVKFAITNKAHGELLVGQAVTVLTDYPIIPYLIYAPTVRTPSNVSNTMNAYLAFRAVLLAAKMNGFSSISCPGLCTYSGEMDPIESARQMKLAYEGIKW